MQLRKLQAEVEEIVNKIKEEEVRLGGIDIDNLVRERNSLEKECKKLSDEVCNAFQCRLVGRQAFLLVHACRY